ncbi:MAG: hypothetical protein QW404_01230 [Candidatus Nanoarchaeia archaeon]
MGHGLRVLRREYVQEFNENEGTFYNHNREIFLKALSKYVTWKFLTETIIGKNPKTFDDQIAKLGLEKNLIEYYYAKRNRNDNNGDNRKGRIAKMMEQRKKEFSIQ